MSSTSDEVRRQIGAFGILGAIGGFISDVLEPLAPVAKYLFGFCLAASLLLLFILLLSAAWRRRLLPAFALSVTGLLVSGVLLVLQTGDAESKGVLASHIPAIEQLQTGLGLIQRDVAEIKEQVTKTSETVDKIAKNTEKSAETTERIATSTDKIAQSLDAIQKGFAGIAKSGGVIESPQRAEEFYHNARIYETRGDYGNARQSYAKFFSFKLDFIDPHLRYQSFLKLQEGVAGARGIYDEFVQEDKRPLLAFARALLLEGEQRVEALKGIVAANPDLAPAYYKLADEYSAARKGTQSLGDKQAEGEALTAFKRLHGEGKLLKYFIDQEVAAKWLEDADARLKALESSVAAGAAPVSLIASRSGDDWVVTLQMMESPREIFYRLEGEDAFRSTGMSQVKNSQTGQPAPNMYVLLKPTTPKTNLYVKYTDVGNEMRGPFKLAFDPVTALFDFQKSTLAMTKGSWVSFRDFDGKVLLYFTHLLTSRCALSKIEYGINSDATPNDFPLPPCDRKNPYNVPETGNIYIAVPADAKYASVKLTYIDHTNSEVVRVDR